MIACNPVILSGHGVRLEPLSTVHADGLRLAAADGALWNLRVTSVPKPDEADVYIAAALKGQTDGHRLAWAVIDVPTARLIGCTSYHDMMTSIDRVEIGYTWYAKSAQRSHVNTACKLLLMTHAFETLGCKVVGFRTDILNFASQRAIERLGAKRDGVIRHHLMRRDGTIRDTVMYSLLISEWDAVKTQLSERLAAPANLAKEPPSPNTVELKDISESNYLALLRLTPGASGERMVASNAKSIVQGEFSPNARMWAIEADQQVVGFIMLFDPSIAIQTKEPNDILYVWRLMIDFNHHGKGYGGQTLDLVKKIAAQTKGIKAIHLSHQQHDGNPGPFYLTQGFSYTGVVEDDELTMEFKLHN